VAPSNGATPAQPNPEATNEGSGLDVGGALSGNGQATAQRSQTNAPTNTAPGGEQKPRGLDATAGLNGDANASAKRDSTQPAGRKVDASASAGGNASADRR
jgi:hypothetical protein